MSGKLAAASELPGLPRLTRAWRDGATWPWIRRYRGSETLPAVVAAPSGELIEDLADRNRELGNEAGAELASRLAEGALAVIAGQQVGLFGGPLLCLWKALEAIRIAAELEASGRPAVPVFWMAAQDHDLPELFEAAMRDGDEAVRLEAPKHASDNRRPVGQLLLGPEPSVWLASRGVKLPPGLESAFDADRTFTQSFSQVLLAALGSRRILLVDPNRPAWMASFGRVFEGLIDGFDAVAEALEQRKGEMTESGFGLQVVHRREQRHWFLHDRGGRHPLDDRGDGGFVCRDGAGSWSESELRQQLAEGRLAVSPSVLMRPAVVSTLLPQAVVVLGPSEVAYWAQATAVFPLLDVEPPALAPRPHLLPMTPPAARLMAKLGVSVMDLASGEEDLARILADREAEGPMARFKRAVVAARQAIGEVGSSLADVDPPLEGAFARSSSRMLGQLEGLEGKAEASWMRRQETLRGQLLRLRQLLVPEGAPNERVDSVLTGLLADPAVADRAAAAVEELGGEVVIGLPIGGDHDV